MDVVRRQYEKISSTEYVCKCLVRSKNLKGEDIEKPCGDIIIIGKESYWNLKRHLNRKHGTVLRQIEAEVVGNGKTDKDSFAWKHFSQLDKNEVMCQLCLETIKTTDGSTAEMVKHLNEAHAGEIKPDIELLNKENVDGTPVKAPETGPGKRAATTGKKKNRKAPSPEDFRSPLGRQFIREQFMCEQSQATCLWCSAKINHSLTDDGDLTPLVRHIIFSHRGICSNALAQIREKKSVARRGSFSPKFNKKRRGATEKFTKKTSSLFAFDEFEDEELYDVHCGSQVETTNMTEQVSDLRKAWLEYCSEREKVHDLEVAKLRMRLREKQLALHELEKEVESMTDELEEKLKCRGQELVRQKVLDARILTKKAMRVREKFYNHSSIAVEDTAGTGCYVYYDNDGCGDDHQERLKPTSRSAKRSHRESNWNDSDRDWQPGTKAKRLRLSRNSTTGRDSCTPASSRKRLSNGAMKSNSDLLRDELELKKFEDQLASINASSEVTENSNNSQDELESNELTDQVAVINVSSLASPDKVHNRTADAGNVEVSDDDDVSSEPVKTKSDSKVMTPDEGDVTVPVIFETTANASETVE